MKKWAWLWLVPIIVLGVGFVLPICLTIVHSYEGEKAKGQISAELHEKYPEIRFNAGLSVTTPTIGVTIYGVPDAERQREIMDSLRELKSRCQMKIEIRLMFREMEWNDPDVITIE